MWANAPRRNEMLFSKAEDVVNYSKTKEMLLDPLSKLNIPPLVNRTRLRV